MKELLIGGDPEMFAVDNEGFCIPPVILEKMGMKKIGCENPDEPWRHPYYFNEGGFIVMGDGAALEVAFPPGKTEEELKKNYHYIKNIAENLVSPLGLRLCTSATVNFSLSYLAEKYGANINEKNFWTAVRFGCDPQFNIYQHRYDQVVDAKEYPWRHAGGHIHFSVPGVNLHGKIGEKVVKFCDLSLGQIAVALTENLEAERTRQVFYGKPGNCRWQTYPGGIRGIEYRTPSVTAWEKGIHLFFPIVEKILEKIQNGEIISPFELEKAKTAIISCDKTAAYSNLETFLEE